MISAVLIPKLRARFPGRGLRVSSPPSPSAVFPAIHPEVGDIQIYDDGDELTVVAGNFTHGHFSNYDEKLSPEQKASEIAEDVVSFLEALFADEVVFWGSHERCGGWYNIGEDSSSWAKDDKKYVWSGPLS
ncbi:MAG: hypothetical protein L0Y72_10155 [Gemmataceae bacterium]|nr:hypothetical protein [Gemmataceae bacterium]